MNELYSKSARYYDAIHHFLDYPIQSAQLHELIQQLNPKAKTLLDVCCGTGKHLELLKNHYDVEGLDINPNLLRFARDRCPEITFHERNMTSFCLNRAFDVIVCLFSSIGNAKTLEDMEKTVRCMEEHLKPGGILIIEPWLSPENYRTQKIAVNFVDEPDLKICWMYTAEIEGRLSIAKIHYLVGTSQDIEHFSERHESGLFTNDEYLNAFHKAKLEVQYQSNGLNKRGMYIGLKNFLNYR